jgi:DNA-binding MarR family transcriptional regulator
MDRAADRVLQEEHGLSYARFLVLLALSRGACSQRAIGSWLGVSEPSVSRMMKVLATSGLLAVTPDPRGGNRRVVRLTRQGEAVFRKGAALLEQRFADLLDQCDIPREQYAANTRSLIAALDELAPAGAGLAGDAGHAPSAPGVHLAEDEAAPAGRALP